MGLFGPSIHTLQCVVKLQAAAHCVGRLAAACDNVLVSGSSVTLQEVIDTTQKSVKTKLQNFVKE